MGYYTRSTKAGFLALVILGILASVIWGGVVLLTMDTWGVGVPEARGAEVLDTITAPANSKVNEEPFSGTRELTLTPTILTSSPTLSPEPTTTIVPIATHTPSATMAPSATFTPTSSPTPTIFFTSIPFSEGPMVIGHSVQGRPLEIFRFGTGPVKRMIIAGIHGGYEGNTTALADELIAHLKENPGLIPRTVTLYILRSLNPDGYERSTGYAGRANENGVDLNRNWPVHWQAEWERRGCWNYLPITSGTGPASEPETQALMDFILKVRPTALISYHSAALGIFPAATRDSVHTPHPESFHLAETLARVSTYPFPPMDTGCVYTGSLPDWAASEGIAAVDIELHTHSFTDFQENLLILEAFLAWRRGN